MNTPQERKNQKSRRKRERAEAFNLNRSTPVVKEKYLRSDARKQREMASNNNRELIDVEMANAQKDVRFQGVRPKNPQRRSHPIDAVRDMPVDDRWYRKV